MKISRDEKKQKAMDIYMQISNCKTEDDIERLSDMADELIQAGYIFKKDYKFLCEELDSQISYLVEKGLV